MAHVISSIGTPDITIAVQGGWATVPMPYYHELFHDGILEVPKQDRRWNGSTKTWSVKEAHLDTLVQLVRDNYFTEPTVEEAE